MESIKLRSHVGPDGLLKLEVPVGVVNMDLDVVVSVEPVGNGGSGSMPEKTSWPEGFIEQTSGAWAGEPLVREPQGTYEVRKPLASNAV